MNDIQRQVLSKLVDSLLEAEYTLSVWKEKWIVEWANNSAEVMAALDQVKVALLTLTDVETGLYGGKIYLLYPFNHSQIIDDAFVIDARAVSAIRAAQELHKQLRNDHERNGTADHPQTVGNADRSGLQPLRLGRGELCHHEQPQRRRHVGRNGPHRRGQPAGEHA